MSASGRAGILVGIVVFHPDEPELVRLVTRVAPGAATVALFANSPLSPELEARLGAASAPTPLALLRPPGNAGLGAAYDALVERGGRDGAAFLLLLDQDSLPGDGMAAELAAVHAALGAAGERPAIVGPLPVGPDGRALKLPRLERPAVAGALPVGFVISSGSLVDLAAAAAVSPFRADFFIDGIDLEWCMRARARGYSIWAAAAVRMDHRLGRGVIRLPFGLRFADQPPRRLYTYLRNALVATRLPHVPRSHKAKWLASLPLRLLIHLARNGFSRECRRAMAAGLRDGWAGRLGPPPDRF